MTSRPAPGEEKGLAGVVGQAAAVRAIRAAAAKPVHAYLLVGPPGTGKMMAARAFAAMLLCPGGGEDGCDVCRRAAEGAHPDLVVVEREGAALSIEQAREVTRVTAHSSVEGGRTVVILPDLHLAADAAPALLKTMEEPPGHVVFLALADFVPPPLATVASRCARIDFVPLSEPEVAGALVAEGVPAAKAASVAALAGGRLDRARLLASDPGAEERRRAWEVVPARLDGSGATVAALVDELTELLKASAEPLAARQEAEMSAVLERTQHELGSAPQRLAQNAVRSAARSLEERHRREQRRQRTDELRNGLAALARAYSERAASGRMGAARAAQAVALIDALSADLAFNPGEQLALQALFVRLERLGPG
ncbi:MAG: ATP-binding protein [Acidimicrobiales bacterium]